MSRPGLEGAKAIPARFAAGVAATLAVSAVVALGTAVTTPPRSGPYCRTACVGYPYTDVAAFVPRDYLWMYPAVVMVLLFVVVVACISHVASPDAKLAGQLALAFAVMSATALVVAYVLQLAVVQPSLLAGETGGLSLISQYNPHGAFIALEDVGYVTMGIAFLCAASALGRGTRSLRAVRLTYRIAGILAVGSLVVMAAVYGRDLEYRYEVAVIVIDWGPLIVSGVLLARAWLPVRSMRGA